MRVIDVPAAAGGQWIKQAFALLRAQPTTWISLVSLWALIFLAILVVPVVGIPIASILMPGFCAGVMRACREHEEGRPVSAGLLFSALRDNGRALVIAGSLLVFVKLGIMYFLMTLGFPAQLPVDANNMIDLQAYARMLQANIGLVLLGMGLMSLVEGVFWFVPPLLAFHKMPSTHAIRWSFYAFIGNFPALLVLGVLVSGLLVLAFLPWFLGLLVWAPLFVLSNYTSYQQVFRDENP